MENQNIETCNESQTNHVPFGEKFAYMAISATIAYTYAIINIMSYMA